MNDFITALQKLVQHHGCGRTKMDRLSEHWGTRRKSPKSSL